MMVRDGGSCSSGFKINNETAYLHTCTRILKICVMGNQSRCTTRCHYSVLSWEPIYISDDHYFVTGKGRIKGNPIQVLPFEMKLLCLSTLHDPRNLLPRLNFCTVYTCIYTTA